MASTDKTSSRNNNLPGWFLVIVGGVMLAIGVFSSEPRPEPWPILFYVFSGLMFISGVLCLIRKPTTFALILGGLSFLGLGIVLILEKEGLNGLMKVGMQVVIFGGGGGLTGWGIKCVMSKIKNKRSKGAIQDPSSSESPPDDQPETHDEP